MIRPTISFGIALLLVSSAACGRRRAETASSPASPGSTTDGDRSRRDSLELADAERDRLDRERADRERMARERAENVRRMMEASIFFGYDRSDLTPESRTTLDAKLELLRTEPAIRLVVEGHTDDRGSDEYNLALGQRRAAAAKRYLTQRGIAGDRIEIQSFGEERPTCDEQAESCWSRNRRDDFRISAGGPVVRQ